MEVQTMERNVVQDENEWSLEAMLKILNSVLLANHLIKVYKETVD